MAVDIDTRDNLTNPKVTDAGRSRLAIIGLLGISILLDWVFKTGILMTAISRQYTALTGLIVFADMDGDFAYIAGYTSGGAPYGVRWEDVGIDSELPFEEKVRLYMDQMKDRADTLSPDDVEELPFD